MELLFYYKIIKGSLKRFADVIYSITEFRRKYLCYPLKYCRRIITGESTRPRSWIGD